MQDVKDFFKYLVNEEKLVFHPDDPFENYVNLETNAPSFTKEEAAIRNTMLQQCFEVCEREGVDIYLIGGNF